MSKYQRLTEQFVQIFTAIKSKTGNSRVAATQKIKIDSELRILVDSLNAIFFHIEDHRKTSKRRLIVQTDPAFSKALGEYREKWSDLWIEGLDLDWDELLRPSNKASETLTNVSHEDWDFDPDEHSAANSVEMAIEHSLDLADEYPHFSVAKGAWDWLTDTVGVDLAEMESRWRSFPVFAIKKGVSDRHGLTERRSLYDYLDNIRMAYVAGADLAAIAMCRAATETVIRIHYKTGRLKELTPIICELERNKKISFIRSENLVEKITAANKILHDDENYEIGKEATHVLIQGWFRTLQKLIDLAPE